MNRSALPHSKHTSSYVGKYVELGAGVTVGSKVNSCKASTGDGANVVIGFSGAARRAAVREAGVDFRTAVLGGCSCCGVGMVFFADDCCSRTWY